MLGVPYRIESVSRELRPLPVKLNRLENLDLCKVACGVYFKS